MQLDLANKIFTVHQLPKVTTIKKIEVGFTNEVYSINDKFIIKLCQNTTNETPFKREATLYNYFQEKLPVPQLITFDDSKSIYPKNYMIYPKIQGENLYNVWHTLSDELRRNLVKQLCELLKAISNTPVGNLPAVLDLEPMSNWHDFILGKINKYLSIVEKAGTFTKSEADKVKAFVQEHSSSLNQQQVTLVYWDAHFDNILFKDDNIVGLLDFERTELASIDFMLDVAKRMVDEPKKYMSKSAEKYAKDKDYSKLLDQYKEFYPELFEFDQLGIRLDLYAIAHNLEDLENWPHVKSLKQNTLTIVG